MLSNMISELIKHPKALKIFRELVQSHTILTPLLFLVDVLTVTFITLRL